MRKNQKYQQTIHGMIIWYLPHPCFIRFSSNFFSLKMICKKYSTYSCGFQENLKPSVQPLKFLGCGPARKKSFYLLYDFHKNMVYARVKAALILTK